MEPQMFLEKDSFSTSHKLQLGGAAEAIERMTTVSQFSESSFPCFAHRDFDFLRTPHTHDDLLCSRRLCFIVVLWKGIKVSYLLDLEPNQKEILSSDLEQLPLE